MANERRLIDADTRIEEIKKAHCVGCDNYGGVKCRACWVDDAIGLIDDAPTVEAVPLGAYEQVRWERDQAMEQLEEHGIPFGGIAPDVVKVVRCRDCKHYDNREGIQWCHLNSKFAQWGMDWHSFPEDGYCSYGERRTEE